MTDNDYIHGYHHEEQHRLIKKLPIGVILFFGLSIIRLEKVSRKWDVVLEHRMANEGEPPEKVFDYI